MEFFGLSDQALTAIITMIGTCHGFARDQSLIVVKQPLSVLQVVRKSTSWV
mgnify:CR=1 FL=1